MNPKKLTCLLIVTAIFTGISSCGKQPVETRSETEKLLAVIPDEIIVVLASDGGDELKPAFEVSMLGKMWNDSQVQSFIEDIKEQIVAAMNKELNKDKAEQFRQVLGYAKLAASRPFAVGIALDKDDEDVPIFGFAIIEAGSKKQQFIDALAKIEQLAEEEGEDIVPIKVGPYEMRGIEDEEEPLYWGWAGDYLVFAIDDEKHRLVQYIEEPRQTPAVNLTKTEVDTDIFVLYADFTKVQDIADFVEEEGGVESEQLGTVRAVLGELGFMEIKTLSSRAGFAGPNMVASELLEVPAPRSGILAAFKPVEIEMFDLAEPPVTDAMAMNLDLVLVYDSIVNAIKAALGDESYREVQQGIADFESEVGIKVRDGFLKSLSGPAFVHSVPMGATMDAPMGGMVVVLKLADRKLFEQQIAVAEKLIEEQFGAAGMLQITQQTGPDDTVIHCWSFAPLAMMQMVPCWAANEDYVFIASHPGLCKKALQRAKSPTAGNSLRNTAYFKEAAKNLPESAVFFSFTDSKLAAREALTFLQSFWPMMTMGLAEQGIKLPAMLPQPTELIEQLGVRYEYCWFDEKGLHSYYEGSGAGVSLAGIAGGAGGLGIMMPALAKVRQLSQTVVSGANLKGIGVGIMVYANDNDTYPTDLKTLVEKDYIVAEQLESPQKPEGFEGPSYIYITGQKPSSDPRNIVVYENPAFCKDKINVVFNDCHVEAMNPAEFEKALKKTYERLGRPMPEIDSADKATRVFSPRPVGVLSGKIDEAKWSEGKAMMGSIAVAIRAYCAEKGPEGEPPTAIIGDGKTDLGFISEDLNGNYFSSDDFSMLVTSMNPLKFTITCTVGKDSGAAGEPPSQPKSYTLDQDGNFTPSQ